MHIERERFKVSKILDNIFVYNHIWMHLYSYIHILIYSYQNGTWDKTCIRREMRPRKGRFRVVPHVGNKLFPYFGGGKKLKKNSYLEKKFYF